MPHPKHTKQQVNWGITELQFVLPTNVFRKVKARIRHKCSDYEGGNFSDGSVRCKGFVPTFRRNFLSPSSVLFYFVRVSAERRDRFDILFTGKNENDVTFLLRDLEKSRF
jgi:hypothetical protein